MIEFSIPAYPNAVLDYNIFLGKEVLDKIVNNRDKKLYNAFDATAIDKL